MKKPANAQRAAEIVPGIVADVFQLAGLFRRWGDVIADTVGQTQARWQVLSAASEGTRSVAQVARRLGVSRQNVQRIADRLVADGLASYADNHDNERSPLVQLTPQGIRSLEKLTQTAAAFHADIARSLPLADLKTTAAVLEKFRILTERALAARAVFL